MAGWRERDAMATGKQDLITISTRPQGRGHFLWLFEHQQRGYRASSPNASIPGIPLNPGSYGPRRLQDRIEQPGETDV